jgi:hypothetical protein
MDLIEFNTHSFIIKIWLEEPPASNRWAKWRGHISHVPSGERRYLKNLWEIMAFMAPYLISMGVKVNFIWRIREWLKRRKAEPVSGEQPTTNTSISQSSTRLH